MKDIKNEGANTANESNKNTNNNAAGAAAPKKIEKVQSLPITGTFSLSDKGNLNTVMDNPLPDVEFDTLSLVFDNPSKQDRFGNEQKDRSGERHAGAFRAYTRAAGGVVRFTGYCSYNSMTDRKNNVFKFLSISIISPFPDADINDGRPVRAYLRNGIMQGDFEAVVKPLLELVPISKSK